jgi:hypothetical protein
MFVRPCRGAVSRHARAAVAAVSLFSLCAWVQAQAPVIVGPEAPYVSASEGQTVTGSIVVASSQLERGRFRIELRNGGNRAAEAHIVPRFFDARGREVLHSYRPLSATLQAGGRGAVEGTAPPQTVRLGLTAAAQGAQQPEPIQVTRIEMTRAQYIRMRTHVLDGLHPIGFGSPWSDAPKGIGWYEPTTGRLRYAIEVRIVEKAQEFTADVSRLARGFDAPDMLWLMEDPSTARQAALVAKVGDKRVVAPLTTLVSGNSALCVSPMQRLPLDAEIEAIEMDGRSEPVTFDPVGALRSPQVTVVTTPGTDLSPGSATFTHAGGPPCLVKAFSPDGTFTAVGGSQIEFVLQPGATRREPIRPRTAGQRVANVGWSVQAIDPESGLSQGSSQGPLIGGTLLSNGKVNYQPNELCEWVGRPPTLEGQPIQPSSSRRTLDGIAVAAIPLALLAPDVFRNEPKVNETSYAVVPYQVDPMVTRDIYKRDETTQTYVVNATQVAALPMFNVSGDSGGAFVPVGNVQANQGNLDPNKLKVEKWDWEIDWDNVQGRDGWTFHNYCDWGPLGAAPWHYYSVFDSASNNIATGECDEVWGFDKKGPKRCWQEFLVEKESRGALWWSATVTVVSIVKKCELDWCKWKLCKYKSRTTTLGMHSYKWVVESKECSKVTLTVAKKQIAIFPEGVEIDWLKIAEMVGGGGD